MKVAAPVPAERHSDYVPFQMAAAGIVFEKAHTPAVR